MRTMEDRAMSQPTPWPQPGNTYSPIVRGTICTALNKNTPCGRHEKVLCILTPLTTGSSAAARQMTPGR